MPPSQFDSSDPSGLGTDPRTGQYRQGEAESAKRLAELVGSLSRDPSGDFDWVDQSGRTYDAVGPIPRAEYFNSVSFNAQIDRHLLKQGLDYVVIDLSNLTPEQRAGVQSQVDGLPIVQQSRIIVVGG